MNRQSMLLTIRSLGSNNFPKLTQSEAVDCVNLFLELLKEKTGYSEDILLSEQVAHTATAVCEQVCVKEGTGYVNSLDSDIYYDMKQMMINGHSNKDIACALGVHINTISKWRNRWKQTHEI